MHQKQKVLIVVDKLNVGGVSSSLINLLQLMSEQLDFYLIIFDKKHSTIQDLPENINIIETPRLLSIMGMTQSETRKENVFLWLIRGMLVVISKLFSGQLARRILFSRFKKYGDYDFGISYVQDVGWKKLTTGCNDFVLRNVNAKKKVSFVHCDFTNYGGYNPKVKKIYEKFDKIVCVSNGCKNSFIHCFPELSQKVFVSENFTDGEKIKRLSSPAICYEANKNVFVSICRLAEEKGIDRTINVFSRLKKESYDNFLWYVVGGGEKLAYYQNLIQELDLNKNIFFVGENLNPYQYLKNANFLLVPSFHEAAPMVFGESIVLGVPVITTCTTSAEEMIGNEGFGLVCENTEDGIYKAVKFILSGTARNYYISIEKINKINDKAKNHFLELIYGDIDDTAC